MERFIILKAPPGVTVFVGPDGNRVQVYASGKIAVPESQLDFFLEAGCRKAKGVRETAPEAEMPAGKKVS